MTLAVFPIAEKTPTTRAASLPSTTTLTMTTGSESADLSLLVNNASGTFSSSSNDELAKFSIATNNYTGYTLTISGSDDTGLLTNTDTTITTNNTFSSIDSTISETTFDTTTYNNKWGYKPSKYNSADNVSFRPAPTTTASTLNVTNCANDTTNCPDTEDDYTIGLGIRADYTKPAGTYTNTFILTATANPVGYSITYADNTGDSTVEDLPSVQAGDTNLTSVTLAPDSTPTRTGYTFRAWCSEETTSNGTICAGTEYTPGDALDFIDQTTASNAVTLYAAWTKHIYMQDFTTSQCATLASSSNYSVYDKRDEQAYTVRYINGNCWMTSNLRFGYDSTNPNNINLELNSTTSNVASTYTESSPLTITTYDLATYGTSNSSYCWGSSSPNTGDGYNYPCIHSGVDSNNNPTVWYNYALTSAMTIVGTSNTASATYDICPKGWKLATRSEQSTVRGYITEFNPVAGGMYVSGVPVSPTYGYFWGATASSSDVVNRYSITYNGSTLGTDNGYGRYAGNYIRCIRSINSVTINFNGNGATSGYMDNQVINGVGGNLPSGTLTANAYEREGYVFTGWNTAQDGSGTSYADGASYTASSTGDSALTLYAQWKEVYNLTVNFNGDGIEAVQVRTAAITGGSLVGTVTEDGGIVGGLDAGTNYYLYPVFSTGYGIENWENTGNTGTLSATFVFNPSITMAATDSIVTITSTTCSSATISGNMQTATAASSYCEGATGSMTDSRDNQIYNITKINGMLWMTRNLAIGCNGSGSSYGSGVSSKTLTSADSNVASNYTTTTNVFNNTNYKYNWSTQYIGCNSSYGGYYNYYTASAGTIYGDANSQEAIYSVCPAGWRLPSHNQFTEITDYVAEFSVGAWPIYIDYGFTAAYGTKWWSSTSYWSSGRWNIHYEGSTISGGINPRWSGFFVRCIRSN